MDLPTAIGTVIGVASLILLRDYRDGKSLFKKNGTNDTSQAIRAILASQEQLKSHYNEDTTKILEDIRDELKTGFGDIKNKHAEWDKFGIPTRDKSNLSS